jgi:hypothetical protein
MLKCNNAATNMRQYDHDEQDATGEGRHGEEIHRGGCREVIREKRLPGLARRA